MLPVTTPHDPQREGQPGQAPYGGPPAQYAVPQPGPYPVPQPGPFGPQPGQPGGQPSSGQPYTYNPYGTPPSPYGTPYPAGLDKPGVEKVPRPKIMIVALVLMLLAALPFLATGAILLLAPLRPDVLPPGLLDDPRLVEAGATPELVISAARVFAGVVLAFALIYIGSAVLAFQGRNWARILATVLTVGFVLLLVVSLLLGATDVASIAFVLVIIAAIVGSVVILFLPDSARFFSAPRQ